jgi:hypothetical protein
MDEATVQLLLRVRQEGLDAINDVKSALGDLLDQAVLTNSALMLMTPAMLGMAAGTQAANTAVSGTVPAASSAAFSLFGMSTATLAVVAAVALAVVVLAPFALLLVGIVVQLAAFAVGVAAVISVLGIAGVLLGAMAAGIVVLAEKTNAGQVAFGQLSTSLSNMATALGQQALPMAQQMAQWAIGMVPLIQTLGQHILDWFGPRLPAILQIASTTAGMLLVAFNQLGAGVGAFLDKAIQMAPQLLPMFQILLSVGVQAVIGLLQNLLALSDWFLQRMPALAPIVGSVMSGIGTAIQAVGTVAGWVVDWFIRNWPQITSTAQQAFLMIKAGWDLVAPILQALLPMAVAVVTAAFLFLSQHAEAARLVLGAVGVMAGITVGTLVVLGLVILGLVVAIAGLISWLAQGVQWLWSYTMAAYGVRDALNAIGSAAHNAVSALSQVPGAIAAGGSGWGLHFQSGGIVPGPIGAPTLAVVHGGERVIPVGGSTDMGDTNELLAAIYQILAARLLAPGLGTAAYAPRG